ncbi:MAG: RNA methyltransferase [Oscillospiraceae bacterium]|nr:RNA methyltransferase [Oscillospiraceae bacterium]
MELITSRKNPLCVHVKKLGANRAYRQERGEFLCDGAKLLEEAIKSNADITAVFTTADIHLPKGVRIFRAAQELLDSLSPLKNAQDVLFTCKMPEPSAFTPDSASAGTHILLDGIQDPGNLGTIIRTANAFGISSVILLDGCADLYSPKTIRASMGAIFRQHVYYTNVSELKAFSNRSSLEIVGTTLEGADVSGISLKNAIIAIGSEGQGLSAPVLSMCRELVSIPMSQGCESLNAAVAASIIMWEAVRHETAENLTM